MDRRRRTLSTLIIAAAAVGLLGSVAGPAYAAAATSSTGLVPAQGVLFGGYAQPSPGQGAEPATAALEASLHRKLDVVRIYRQWDDPEPDPTVVTALKRGRIPVLSIRPRYKDGRIVTWASIARGDADAVIAKQADGLRSLPGPLFLAFHHEPDDVAAAGYGTPADYVAAWRHYRQVFIDRGVTNVTWVWITTPSVYRAAGVADSYYPGDDAVDWIAEDAYNWYGCSAGKPAVWRTPADLIGPLASWAAPHGKPLMLAEWGSVEDPAEPGRKAQWLRDGLAATRTWPQLKAMSYFDAVGTCDWRLTSSAAALQALADDGQDPAAHGKTSAFLVPSASLGVAPLTVHFDGSASTAAGSPSGAGIATWTLDFGDGSSASGVGQPPADVAHPYAAGSYPARLRVTDPAGAVDQDEWTVTAAAAPQISGNISAVTTTSALVNTWIAPQGYAASAYAEWGTTTGYGQKSAVAAIAATSSTAAVAFPLAGLTPGTHYYVRVTATSAAGTRVRMWTVDTLGPPGITAGTATWPTTSSATLNGLVNPRGFATTYYFDWGTSAGYGYRTPSASLDPVTWAVYVKAALSGLDRHQTYHYRLVAANLAGTSYGPDQTFTTT
jgi:hypothetical protein